MIHTTFLSLLFCPISPLILPEQIFLRLPSIQQKDNSEPCVSLSAVARLSMSCTVFPSITPSLLHQHQIGLQPGWHCAGSQGSWTLTHFLKTNLPPIHNSAICRWLIFINEYDWNERRSQRNKVQSAAWWYIPAVSNWRSWDLLFTMSTASSAWDFPVRQEDAGFALRSLQWHTEEKLTGE